MCERRDRIPEVPKEKINELKNRDRIFSKRYRQYEAAKFSDKAPFFDPTDLVSKSFITPNNFAIQRRKQELIDQQQSFEASKSSKFFQSEMCFLREKTKSFIQSISEKDSF